MRSSHPLKRPFELRIDGFGRHLSKTVEGEADALHQGRVASRRLRECLLLCASEVSPKLASRARRRLRRVGRALGEVREVDVSLGIVEGLRKAKQLNTDSGILLLKRLLLARENYRERMLHRLSSENTQKLRRDLDEVSCVLSVCDQTDRWAQLLAVRLDRLVRRVEAEVREAGALYISDRVHRVRISVKKLRYSLELAGETGEAQTKNEVRELKQVQGTLGRLHDLEVLRTTIQDLTISAMSDGLSGSDLEKLRVDLDRECRELHSRYVGERDSLLRIVRGAAAVGERIWIARGGELSSPSAIIGKRCVVKMTIPVSRSSSSRVLDGKAF